jgi:hypothetical protein
MCRLGLTRFVGQPYVSLFAITLETYKESLTRGRNHASGGRPALILDLSKVETGTLFVFNGDVQNLSDPPEATRVHEFSGHIKQVRDFVSSEYPNIAGRKNYEERSPPGHWKGDQHYRAGHGIREDAAAGWGSVCSRCLSGRRWRSHL